jgi:hypothetical protein
MIQMILRNSYFFKHCIVLIKWRVYACVIITGYCVQFFNNKNTE